MFDGGRSSCLLRGCWILRNARRNDSISCSSVTFWRSAISTNRSTSSICCNACSSDSTICRTSSTALLMASAADSAVGSSFFSNAGEAICPVASTSGRSTRVATAPAAAAAIRSAGGISRLRGTVGLHLLFFRPGHSSASMPRRRAKAMANCGYFFTNNASEAV